MTVEAQQPLKISVPLTSTGTVPTQYTAVKADAAGNAEAVTANTDDVIGILQGDFKDEYGTSTPYPGQTAELVVMGVTKMVAGGTIGIGARVTIDASGNAVASSGTNEIGRLYGQVAAASGDICTVVVNCVPHGPAS